MRDFCVLSLDPLKLNRSFFPWLLFQQDEGRNGDDFMNEIQTIAAYVPYMTCPGNHERY